jgi:type I restriction enzyme, S subunit
MTVEAVRVGDVLALQRRLVDVQLEGEYEEIGVRSFGRGIFHKEPVSGADLGSKRVFRIEPGDLVISNVFAWEGAIAVASKTEAGRIGSHRFMTFVPTDGRISTSWASWFFRSDRGLELIQQASPGSAGRNRTLAIDRFEALEIPLPPVDMQRCVAARLNRLEAATTELQRHSEHASALSDSLAISVSARPDLDDQAKAHAGWQRVSLGDILELVNVQLQVQPTQRYRIAGIYSFGRGLIDRGSISGADTSYSTLTLINDGDVVISKLGGWEGAVAVVGPDFDGYFVSNEYPTFKPDRAKLLPAFFAGIARSPRFWDELSSNTYGSMARRKRITAKEFLAIQIWLPPMETQQHTARSLQVIDVAAKARITVRERIDVLMSAGLNEAFVSLR